MLNFGRDKRRAASACTGKRGEETAAALLRRLGWTILDRNWRSGRLELDLVCQEGSTVVFVEVKTRTLGGMQSPAEALTLLKKERLVRAAECWLEAHDAWESPCRFDLVCVVAQRDTYQTELIRDVIRFGDAPGHTVGRGNAAWQPW